MEGYYRLTKEFAVTPVKLEQVGKGLALEPMIGRRGAPQLNTGVARIAQSLQMILSTSKGTRFFNPSFGSRLHSLLFDQNIFSKRAMAKAYAEEAIALWEPRVTAVQVTPASEQTLGRLSLSIFFRVKGDNGKHTVQFDLNQEGGTIYGFSRVSN